jgi:threonine dehydratase
MTLAITFDDVAAAAQRLAGHAHRTPVLTSRTLTWYSVPGPNTAGSWFCRRR